MKELMKKKVTWIVAVALAVLAVVLAVYFAGGYDSYENKPGVVYNDSYGVSR